MLPVSVLHTATIPVYYVLPKQLEEHSIEVHYSRRPFDRLTVYDRREGKGTATLEHPVC